MHCKKGHPVVQPYGKKSVHLGHGPQSGGPFVLRGVG